MSVLNHINFREKYNSSADERTWIIAEKILLINYYWERRHSHTTHTSQSKRQMKTTVYVSSSPNLVGPHVGAQLNEKITQGCTLAVRYIFPFFRPGVKTADTFVSFIFWNKRDGLQSVLNTIWIYSSQKEFVVNLTPRSVEIAYRTFRE